MTMTILLTLSGAIRTWAFVPTATTMSGTPAAPATTNPVSPSIDPSQPPSLQSSCSSSSALAAFFFPGNTNNDDNNDDDDNRRNDEENSSNKKKNDDGDEEEEWWKRNDFLNSIKYVFTKRNEFLDSIKNSLNTPQEPPPSEGGNPLLTPMSQFFQPPGIRGPFNNSGGNSNSNRDADVFGYGGDDGFDDDYDEDEDDLPAGTSLLFRIPAKQLKPGGLRLFLMFYLMGMQNTPDRNTWRADQRLMSVNMSPKGVGDDEEEEEKTYVLEMLYDKDRSGMLQIELLPANGGRRKRAEIRIYRCGSRPSTSYLMQESVIVDGVLDELQNISGEKDNTGTIPPGDSDPDEAPIADEDRLLITDPPNAIESARESLAFS